MFRFITLPVVLFGRGWWETSQIKYSWIFFKLNFMHIKIVRNLAVNLPENSASFSQSKTSETIWIANTNFLHERHRTSSKFYAENRQIFHPKSLDLNNNNHSLLNLHNENFCLSLINQYFASHHHLTLWIEAENKIYRHKYFKHGLQLWTFFRKIWTSS